MVCLDTETVTDLGCIPNDPIGFVAKFYTIGLSMVGAVAVVFIIYGGYTLLMSNGKPQEIEKGKSYIFYSIAGLLLVVFGFVFIRVIAVDILALPGFN